MSVTIDMMTAFSRFWNGVFRNISFALTCDLFLLLYHSWAVVVPTESDPRRPPKYELVIYLSPKVNAVSCTSSSHCSGEFEGLLEGGQLFCYRSSLDFSGTNDTKHSFS